MDITALYLELCRLQNLSESLLRSIQFRDLEEPNQPDLALVEFLTKELAELAERVSTPPEIPAHRSSDLGNN
jgi:hypothetical protein